MSIPIELRALELMLEPVLRDDVIALLVAEGHDVQAASFAIEGLIDDGLVRPTEEGILKTSAQGFRWLTAARSKAPMGFNMSGRRS